MAEKKSDSFRIVVIVCAVIALIAFCAWIYQCVTGLQVTGMRDQSSWGLYITNFMLFVGLSAGGLIISSAPRVFGLKGFEGVSKVAVLTSIICTVLAVAFVIIDLGSPQRVFSILISAHFTSPLVWDFIILAVYLVLSIVYLRMMIKGSSESHLKAMSIAALVVAVLVHSITAWIFALNSSRAFWNTALMAPWFVVSALVSGTALVLIVCVLLSRAGRLSVSADDLSKMAKLVAIFVCVDLFFMLCEVLTGLYSGAGSEYEAISILTTGAAAPLFWLEVVCGVVAVVIGFAPSLRGKAGVAAAGAAAAILSVFFKRFSIIEDGFTSTNLSFPGIATGPAVSGADGFWQGLAGGMAYWPTAFEVFIVLGVICLGIAAFLFCYDKCLTEK